MGGRKIKKKFFGYIPYDKITIKELWESATFVVDANILLNLYRYSKDTQEQVIECLNKIQDRLWIPHNTANEYFNNRFKVISEQVGVYKKITDSIINFDRIRNDVNQIRHLTLDKKEILVLVKEFEGKINNLLNKDKKFSDDFLNDDPVLAKLVTLFDGRIGEEISEADLVKLKKNIDIRYSKRIPPGYKDRDKGDDKKYGDCINWLGTIQYSKDKKKNVIYISDDNKEDWMVISDKKVLGPRPELLNEFYRETNGNIVFIYNTTDFLENFNKYINKTIKISFDAIQEVKNVRADQERYNIGVINTSVELESMKNKISKVLNRRLQDVFSLKNKYLEIINEMHHNGLQDESVLSFQLKELIEECDFCYKQLKTYQSIFKDDNRIAICLEELKNIIDILNNYFEEIDSEFTLGSDIVAESIVTKNKETK